MNEKDRIFIVADDLAQLGWKLDLKCHLVGIRRF